MSWESPVWLLGLVPWAAFVVWTLRGRPPGAAVPFLPLWRGGDGSHRSHRRYRLPPVPVLLMLGALLLAITAAAGPRLVGVGSAELPVTLVVDRGAGMSARGERDLRFRESAGEVVRELARRFGASAKIRAVDVPGGGETSVTLRDVPAWARGLRPTALDTADPLQSRVARRLADAQNFVLAVTDRPTGRHSDRLIEVAPPSAPRDAAIVLLAARSEPRTQVMVRLRNDSNLRSAELAVSSGPDERLTTVELPAAGGEKDVLVDLPVLGEVVHARLRVSDAVEFDKDAWLVREGSSPRIESSTLLPSELRRLIDAYQKARPATPASGSVRIVEGESRLSAEAGGVVVPALVQATAAGEPGVVDHPLTANVKWAQFPPRVLSAGPPPAGWTPLVTAGGRVLVACREAPARAVWVGFGSAAWARTPDYVVFWTNVFDWTGGGGTRYVAHDLADWTPEWKPESPAPGGAGAWPGLYRRSDGARRAFRAPPISHGVPAPSDWRAALARVRPIGVASDAGPWLILAAMILLGVAAFAARNRRAGRPGDGRVPGSDRGLTAFSPARTF